MISVSKTIEAMLDRILIDVFSDNLLEKPSSFLYGQSPMAGQVPIYAMITMCDSAAAKNTSADVVDNRRTAYIPVSTAAINKTFGIKMNRTSADQTFNGNKYLESGSATERVSPAPFASGLNSISGESYKHDGDKGTVSGEKYPHFHVTYWMFYPYSQVRRERKGAKSKKYS